MQKEIKTQIPPIQQELNSEIVNQIKMLKEKVRALEEKTEQLQKEVKSATPDFNKSEALYFKD